MSYKALKGKLYENKRNNQLSVVLSKKNLKDIGLDICKEKKELILFIKTKGKEFGRAK